MEEHFVVVVAPGILQIRDSTQIRILVSVVTDGDIPQSIARQLFIEAVELEIKALEGR